MATNSSKAKHTNRKTSDEYVDKCTPFPGEEVHRLLHLQEESWVVGRAFLCTWLENLACCFSDCTVCRNHLQILIPGGWGESIWLLSPKCVLCTHECGSSWGSHLPKARAAPSARSATSVSLWLEQAVLLSHYSGTRESLSPLRRHWSKCSLLPLTHFLHHRDQIQDSLGMAMGRINRTGRRPIFAYLLCDPLLTYKLSQDLDFDSIHCCIPGADTGTVPDTSQVLRNCLMG